MSIDFEFAPLDVDLLFHPKAMAAGVEAMGLWTWSMLWSQKVGADGKLPRHVLVSAWGGSKSVIERLAKRLVSAGLWVETSDGWEIWNYLRKNQSAADKEKKRAQGRARMQRLRDRSKKRDAPGDACDASRDAHVRDQSDAPDPSPALAVLEPERDPEPLGADARPIAEGTASADLVVAEYEQAVSSVTEVPFALDYRSGDRGRLLRLLATYCPGKPVADVRSWVRESVTAWVTPRVGEPDFASGFAPRGFETWLRGGRKPPKRPVSFVGQRGGPRQPHDMSCWSMPTGTDADPFGFGGGK